MAHTQNETNPRLISGLGSDNLTIYNKLLQASIHLLPEGIGIFDKKGNIKYANDNFKGIIQLVKHKKDCNLFESPGFPKNLLEHIMSDEPFEVIIYFDNDGNPLEEWNPKCVTIRTRVSPIEYMCSKSDYFVVISENVSVSENNSRHIEEMSREALRKARENEKIKTTFLANMGNEIRMPLNSIVGFIQLLSDPSANLMSAEEKSGLGALAKQYVNVLMTIVDDIIDLSKFESGKSNPDISDINLNDICRASLESVREKLPEGVELRLDIPKKYESVVSRTDAKQLMRLLTNYLSNACKHTSQGSITLGFRLENTLNGVMVHFEVNDTGIGVPKEKAKEIFAPFRKLDEFKQGTGLGLHICSLIADMLNGTVYLNENYTQGASFAFDMPLIYVK